MADLLLPFQFPFMHGAFYIALLIGPPTALLSCFLVLKGWSLMGDAVAHAVLPGIVLAYILGWPLIIGAFLAGMICSVATGYLDAHSRVRQDTVMGVVFSGMFGLGLVLYAKIESSIHLDHILFGNMLGVNGDDLWTSATIGILVCGALLLAWKDLLLNAFDPAQAKTIGLPVNLLHYGLLTILSLTIVATLKAVGLILAIGLLIAPGAIAFLITRQFKYMLVAAVFISTLSLVGGVYLSFFIGSDPGPTVILVLTILFLVAFVIRLIRNRSVIRAI
ncbi:MAG: metal ABC transporter permease [Pseudomonadota bacterium]